MSEPRLFVVAPPLRCCWTRGGRPGAVCGDRAYWEGIHQDSGAIGFWCDQHRLRTDTPIAGEREIRRVCLTVQVYVTAVDPRPLDAHAEVLELVDREVRRLGGVLNLVDVTSEVGRGTFQPARGKLRMVKADRR